MISHWLYLARSFIVKDLCELVTRVTSRPHTSHAKPTHFDPRWLEIIGIRARYSCAVRNQDKHSFCPNPPFFSFVSQSSSSGNPSLHGSMSSSADFSDEDDYSVKSGSASPAPGDTLPWNLPRHERSKRKMHGGSVLDPAERAVLRIAGEKQSPCCYRIQRCIKKYGEQTHPIRRI